MTTLHVTLVTEGPVLSAGLGADLVGLDATMRRDGAERAVLPGSHIRGRVREALGELLATLEGIDDPVTVEGKLAPLFGGAPGVDGGGPASALLFGDLTEGGTSAAQTRSAVLTEEALDPRKKRGRRRAETRTHVAIDRHSGTARKANLGFVEAGAQGTRRTWQGTVSTPAGGVAGLTEAELCSLIAWGLRLAGAVGRNTMSGWGRVVDVKVGTGADGGVAKLDADRLVPLLMQIGEAAAPTPVAWPARTPAAVADPGLQPLDIAIVLHSPLLVSDGGAVANVFEGRTDIPGSVIRRGLADALLHAAGRRRGGWVDGSLAEDLPADLRPLAGVFGALRSSFGFAPTPDVAGQVDAPVRAPWPASVVIDDNKGTCLLRQLADGQADPRLLKHWVADKGPATHCRQDHVRRTLLANVAKDRRTGAGAEGQLFVNRVASDTWQVGDQLERARFYARLWAPADAITALRALLPHVEALGKSIGRGLGRVQIYELPPEASAIPVEHDGWKARLKTWNDGRSGPTEVPVTLVTEALLLDAAGWLGGAPLVIGTELTDAYTDAWRAVTGIDTLQIAWFSASHRLRGAVTARGRAALPPLVTTLPGSSFLLRVPGMDVAEVAERLDGAANRGIERTGLVKAAEERWKRIVPYQSASGYGQILLAHPIHTQAGGAQ